MLTERRPSRQRHALAAACGASLLALACGAPAPSGTATGGAAPAPPAKPAAPAASAGQASPGQPAVGQTPQAPAAPATRTPPPLVALKSFDLQITSSAGNYIAMKKGYFAEEGIEVELVRANSSEQVPLLATNQIQIGAGGNGAGLFNGLARGIPVKIVADHGSNLPDASAGGIAIRKDLVDSGAFRGPADLRGRRVSHSSPGSTGHIAVDRYLRPTAITLADLDLTVLPFPEMVLAFENKAIDAASFQEPYTTLAAERGLIVRGPIGYDLYPYQQIGVLLFSERLLTDRALGLRYMRAYVRGVRDYVRAMQERDPAAFDEVVPILIEYTLVKERALFEKAVPSGLKGDPLPNVQSLVDDQEWYLAHGYQTQRLNVPESVDTSFVEQIIQELGPYAR
jgi:NitT/TauT family transport system substrate-binding protein